MQNSVFSLIMSRKIRTEDAISFICREVLKGVHYLHSFGRVHRDIKSENILFNSKGEVKITDFGFSAQLTMESTCRTTIVGTPSYMAPEFVDGDGYDEKVDVWAVGVLAYEMAEGKVPVIGSNKMEILTTTNNSPSPVLSNQSDWSENFNDFLSKCLKKNPDERPSSENLLFHPFLLNLNPSGFELLIHSN